MPLQAFYTSTFDGNNGEPYGTGYGGAFNIAESSEGYFGPSGHPNIIAGPNGGPDNGQIVIVTELLVSRCMFHLFLDQC